MIQPGGQQADLWKEFEGKTNSKEYKAFKEERARPIFDAIAKRAPDAHKSAVVEQIASPITHARFLRRHEGNYGPAIAAGSGVEFPTVTTPLPGYYRCGDSTTAGIGVPAVASSGAQCANALLTRRAAAERDPHAQSAASGGKGRAEGADVRVSAEPGWRGPRPRRRTRPTGAPAGSP